MTTFWLHPNIMPYLWPNGSAPPAGSASIRYQGTAETAAAFLTAEWGAAVSRCDVIGLFVDACRDRSTGGSAPPNGTGTDGFLTGLVAMANAYDKDIAIEAAGPIGNAAVNHVNGGTTDCSTGALSATYDLDTSIANLITLGAAPGSLWIGMDHPLQRVIDGLGQTLAQAIDQVVEYMQTIHTTYPDIKIGLVDQHGNWVLGLGGGVGAYFTDLMTDINAAQERLAFLNVDAPYEYVNGLGHPNLSGETTDWFNLIKLMQDSAVSYGVPFGLVVNSAFGGGTVTEGAPDPTVYHTGTTTPGSNAIFQRETLKYTEQARRRIAAGRLAALDHLIVESWFYYPRDLAPDTTAYTFADTFIKARAVFLAT